VHVADDAFGRRRVRFNVVYVGTRSLDDGLVNALLQVAVRGTPDEVLKNPKKERTRAFLASHKQYSL